MAPINSTASKDEQPTRKPAPQPNQLTNPLGAAGAPLPSVQRDVDVSRLQPNQVLSLQRSIGNRAVQRLVSTSRAPVIQTKLEVGPVGDRYEQEADRIAAQVVKSPAPQAVQREDDPAAIQRDHLEEEEEETTE